MHCWICWQYPKTPSSCSVLLLCHYKVLALQFSLMYKARHAKCTLHKKEKQTCRCRRFHPCHLVVLCVFSISSSLGEYGSLHGLFYNSFSGHADPTTLQIRRAYSRSTGKVLCHDRERKGGAETCWKVEIIEMLMISLNVVLNKNNITS